MRNDVFEIGKIEELSDLVADVPFVPPSIADDLGTHFNSEEDFYKYIETEIKDTNKYFLEWLKLYCGQSWVPKETYKTGLFAFGLLYESGQLPTLTWQAKEEARKERGGLPEETWRSAIFRKLDNDNDSSGNGYFLDEMDKFISRTRDIDTNWGTAIFIYRMFEKQAELNRKQIH